MSHVHSQAAQPGHRTGGGLTFQYNTQANPNDLSNSQLNHSSVNNTLLVGDRATGFREKLVARLGNAQLSESKNNESYGVEEQENEDESLRGNSGLQQYRAGAQEMDEGGSEFSNL
jgi:hypothetical protein